MGRNIIAAAALSTALSFNSPAAAQPKDEVLTFSPSGPWNVDFAEDFCALKRDFKAGDDLGALELRQYEPGEDFDLIFLAQGVEEPSESIEFRFLPHEALNKPRIGFAMKANEDANGIFTTGRFGPHISEDGESGEVAPPIGSHEKIEHWAKSTSGLRFESGFEQTIEIETGPLNEVRQVMQTCLEDLIESWGVDSEAHQSALRSVEPKNEKRWARKIQHQYPSAALVKEIQGPVQIRLIVDPEGKPESCRSLHSMSKQVLRAATCEGMMRYARFEPALDKHGKPMTSYYVTRVTYMLH